MDGRFTVQDYLADDGLAVGDGFRNFDNQACLFLVVSFPMAERSSLISP